jgi:hypothetical protein
VRTGITPAQAGIQGFLPPGLLGNDASAAHPLTNAGGGGLPSDRVSTS